MKITDKIKIAGQVYDVKYNSKMPSKRGHNGECDSMDNEITIDPNLKMARQEQVLIHEIIEAINMEYPLELEHVQIEMLEVALYQIIVDNPDMFKD
jgi:hypothetical protein